MELKHKTLEELFTPIADAIRGQTGDTGEVIADDFPDILPVLFGRIGKDALTLAANISGTPYATVADLRAAVASAVAAIGPNATWAQVQYYIINNAVVDAETAQAEADAEYWWHNGGAMPPLKVLLKYMARYIVSGNIADLSNPDPPDWPGIATNAGSVAFFKDNSSLSFRRTSAGAHYVPLNMTALRNRIALLSDTAKTTTYYDSVGKKLNLSWYQIQAFLIATDTTILDPEAAKTTVDGYISSATTDPTTWLPSWLNGG